MGEPAELVGRRVRALREQARLSMRALAAQVGVSQPFLSQLERGSTSPSMVTLYRIAAALGVTPGDLLPPTVTDTGPDGDAVEVVRAAEGARIPVADRPDAAAARALLMGPAAGLEVLEYVIRPGEHITEWFASAGPTGVYVLSGAISVEVEGAGVWRLATGDFLHHPGRAPNRWLPEPGVEARVLLIARR